MGLKLKGVSVRPYVRSCGGSQLITADLRGGVRGVVGKLV